LPPKPALMTTKRSTLEGIDPHHPILSIQDQREAIAAAKKRVQTDTRKEAMKALQDAAYEKERGREGMRTGDPVKDELVWVTLDLAEHSDRIVLNGTIYLHGHTYQVPRHVADTMREIQARGHEHQNTLDGKGIAELTKKPRMTVCRLEA
jgi:hypothetical protein